MPINNGNVFSVCFLSKKIVKMILIHIFCKISFQSWLKVNHFFHFGRILLFREVNSHANLGIQMIPIVFLFQYSSVSIFQSGSCDPYISWISSWCKWKCWVLESSNWSSCSAESNVKASSYWTSCTKSGSQQQFWELWKVRLQRPGYPILRVNFSTKFTETGLL